MPHPLVEQLDRIRQRGRRLILWQAVVYVLVATSVAAVLFASVDCLLRIEDRGTRWLLTIAWLAACGVSVWRWLLPAIRMQWSLESVARMIERRFPTLRDRLSSSVAFLRQTDEEIPYGSKSLMRNLIAQTTSDVVSLDLGIALDARPLRRSLAIAACVAALVGAAWVFSPSLSSLAARRLVSPWSDASWPRIHNLRFVNMPSLVARGSDLLFVIEDASGRPPQQVELQLKEDGRGDTESWAMSRSNLQLVFERKNVTRSFQYRAMGGDHTTMAWSEIKVVEPPRMVSSETKLVPPNYTGWLPALLGKPQGLRVFEGTEVSFSGTADRSLSRAELLFDASGVGQAYVQHVENGSQQFHVPAAPETWRVKKQGEYQLHLVGSDETESVAAERWSVRVVRDQSPTIQVLDATTEEWITADATIPLDLNVEDDLRIRRVELHFLRSDQSDGGETVVSLYEGPEKLPPMDMPVDLRFAAERKTIDYDWSLEESNLADGTILSYYVTAEDYKGQRIQLPPQKLLVLTEQELSDRVARRHSVILARLQQRLEQQRQAKQLVESVAVRLEEMDKIDKSTMDRLQSAVLSQRQVNAALAGPTAAVTAELRGLQRVLNRSHIGDGNTQQSVTKTLSAIQALADDHLQPAVDAASAAQQSMQAVLDQNGSQPTKNAKQSLADTESHQAAAALALAGLLDEMASWDNYRRVAQDLGELLRQQDDVKRQTEAVSRQMLTRTTRELDGEQRAAMRSVASRQLELSRRTERTLENLAKARRKLEASDPASAQMLGDAMETANELAVAGRMRQAGKMIGDGRLGAAAEEQESAAKGIEEMLDQLSRRSYTAKESEQRLEDAGRELQRLQARQRQLSDGFRNAGSEPNKAKQGRELQRLTKRQMQQLAEMEKLQRKLKRLRAQQASDAMAQAQAASSDAAAAAEQESALEAAIQSKLAERQMEQAEQHMKEQIERVKSQLVAEQMTKLPQRIEAVLHRQTSVNEEVVRLDELRNSRGEWTSGMQASVRLAAETERTLASDAVELSASIEQLPAYAFAVREVAVSLGEIGSRLEQAKTATTTQSLGKQVVDELKAMLETLKKEKPGQGAGAGQGGGGAGQQGDDEGFEPSLAQLKLLRHLQVRINEETQRLSQAQAGDSDAQQVLDGKIRRVAERQGRLAEMVTKLYRTTAPKVGMPGEPEQPTEPAEEDAFDELDKQLDLLLQ